MAKRPNKLIPPVGMGDKNYQLAVYIGNRPPLEEYEKRRSLKPCTQGELAHIANTTGNHWRKVFSVYAKIVFELDDHQHVTWQNLRDDYLLQPNSGIALLFNASLIQQISNNSNAQDYWPLQMIAGKQHAQNILSEQDYQSLDWIDSDFALCKAANAIITPYFDYRQLSNEKINRLVHLIGALSN